MRSKLKALIIEKYRNQSRFAVCCGKKEQWISRIIHLRQEPTAEEKTKIQRKLNIPDTEIESYFLTDDK